MKKNRTNRLTRHCLLWVLCLFLPFFSLNAQKRVKDYCGFYYTSMESLRQRQYRELEFFNFQPGQTVASIGAQCGHFEAAYAATTDSVHFYLEDIDTSFFNKRQVGFAWHYYDSLRGRPMTCPYTMIIGTEKSTLLPENSFDKIIIINSFHEFTYRDEMLTDIKTKLKPGGILYIDETVPKKEGELHVVCKMPMLTQEEMISLLSKNGFKYLEGKEIVFTKKKLFRKIYAFVKTASPG